jgi:hypothetical protein
MPGFDLFECDHVKIRRKLPAAQRTTSQFIAGKHADHGMLRGRHVAGAVQLGDAFVMVHVFKTVKKLY